MSASTVSAASQVLPPVAATEPAPQGYSLAHVIAMPISFAIVLLLTRLAAS